MKRFAFVVGMVLALCGVARADVYDDLRAQYEALAGRVTNLENRVTALESSAPQPPHPSDDYTDMTQWVMTFNDEFDEPDVDTSKWHFDFAGGDRSLSGNAERQFYMDSKYTGTCPAARAPLYDPHTIKDGVLSITAVPTPDNVKPCIWYMPYVSGMLRSDYSQQYGRFVMRAKLTKGQGFWPAFWLLAVQRVWPPEMDPLEAFGDPNANGEGGVTKFHWGWVGKPGGGAWVDTGVDLTADFHVYAIEWYADRLEYYFDNQHVATQKPDDTFNQPFYIIANLAVGGSWPGDPDKTTPFPGVLQIDFIRAYKHL
jgi:beta-glucanase (GH16 family)